MGSKNLYHLLVEHNTIRLFRFLSMDQKQADDDPINAPGSKVPRILYGSFDQSKLVLDHHYGQKQTSDWSPPPPLMRGRAATALGCSSGGREPHLEINLLSQKRRNSATCHQAKGTLVQLKDGPPGRLLHLF